MTTLRAIHTGLLCLRCHHVSWNPHDVRHAYCGHCHLFLATHEHTIVYKEGPLWRIRHAR